MFPVNLPNTLGHENAGWVHAVGAAVEHVAVGDTVIVHPLMSCGLCRHCCAGDDMHCSHGVFPGIDADGGFAESQGRRASRRPSSTRRRSHRTWRRWPMRASRLTRR